MPDINNLEKRLEKIEERNRRVEIDKAWEVSWFRRILLMIFTYLAIGLYMNAIEISDPWLNAIIPSIGFLLSTLSLPFFKKLWIDFHHKSNL